MLYSELAVIAMIPGKAYLSSKLRMDWVPSSVILGADIWIQTFVMRDVRLAMR